MRASGPARFRILLRRTVMRLNGGREPPSDLLARLMAVAAHGDRQEEQGALHIMLEALYPHSEKKR